MIRGEKRRGEGERVVGMMRGGGDVSVSAYQVDYEFTTGKVQLSPFIGSSTCCSSLVLVFKSRRASRMAYLKIFLF
jgi:hypothetical protein